MPECGKRHALERSPAFELLWPLWILEKRLAGTEFIAKNGVRWVCENRLAQTNSYTLLALWRVAFETAVPISDFRPAQLRAGA